MYTNHVNPVALENQDRFCRALFTLMEQKPLERISVTELCRAAGFERMTFYRHFDEKADVITYYLDRQAMLLLASLPARSTFQKNLNALFEQVYRERRQLCALLDHRIPLLHFQTLTQNIFSMLTANLSSEELSRLPAFLHARTDPFWGYSLVGIFSGLLSAWRLNGFVEPAEQVAHRMKLLLCLPDADRALEE